MKTLRKDVGLKNVAILETPQKMSDFTKFNIALAQKII